MLCNIKGLSQNFGAGKGCDIFVCTARIQFPMLELDYKDFFCKLFLHKWFPIGQSIESCPPFVTFIRKCILIKRTSKDDKKGA